MIICEYKLILKQIYNIGIHYQKKISPIKGGKEMLGSWEIKVSTSGMPQKIASAVGDLKLVGAEYTPIAYLGSQQVNGVNHAVLAEQLVITGKDTKNAVILIFNEKANEATLVAIERVLESGGELGGVQVNITTDIPADAKEAFESVFEGYVGLNVKPFALLGTQVTKGTNFIFAAEVEPVTREPEKKVALVTVNAMTKDIAFSDMLATNHDVMSLGYAFTWLKKGTSFGAPLAEWP